MALPASRIRVPCAPKSVVSTIGRCKSTVVPAAMVEAKSRVREHARHISRTTVSKATPAPAAYVFKVTFFFFFFKTQIFTSQVGRDHRLDSRSLRRAMPNCLHIYPAQVQHLTHRWTIPSSAFQEVRSSMK